MSSIGPKEHRVWYQDPTWWLVIIGVLACIIAAISALPPIWKVFGAILGADEPETVPIEDFQNMHDKCDSLMIDNDLLKWENWRLRKTIDSIENTPIVLDIRHMVYPAGDYRPLADSLEIMVCAGMQIPPHMLLKLGNASAAVGNFEQAERFYWRVFDQAVWPGQGPEMMVAALNASVVNGVLGDFEERDQFLASAMLIRMSLPGWFRFPIDAAPTGGRLWAGGL